MSILHSLRLDCLISGFLLIFVYHDPMNVKYAKIHMQKQNTWIIICNTGHHLYLHFEVFFFFPLQPIFLSFFFFLVYFSWRLSTLQYFSGFCHTLIWISHGFTCVPHPEPPFHLSPHPIPLGHPSAPAPSTLSHASNLDWRSVSHMIIYIFSAILPDRPTLALSQSPKDCSIHLCLLCCLAYRVIVTIFLNSIYMC